MQPILYRYRNRLDQDSGVKKHVPCNSSQRHQCFPVIAAFVQDQGDIGIAVGSVLSTRARTKKYCTIQPYISGNPREEIAYGALGIWIQEFHSRHFVPANLCNQ